VRQFDINDVRANVSGFFKSVQKEGAIVYRLGYPLAVVVRYELIWHRALAASGDDIGSGGEVYPNDFDDWRDYQARMIEEHWERDLE
jgi:hypothetical protein